MQKGFMGSVNRACLVHLEQIARKDQLEFRQRSHSDQLLCDGICVRALDVN